MKVINFSHPLTAEQKNKIEELSHEPIDELVEIMAQFDFKQPFDDQIIALLDRVGWGYEAWQTNNFIVNLPALSAGAGIMMRQLHQRCGYHPAIIRMSPVQGALPPRFEVAELI